MNAKTQSIVEHILKKLELKQGGIFGYDFDNIDQLEEICIREKVSRLQDINFMKEIAKHHSVSVMDRELDQFLKKIPTGGIIIDVGGGWGWHWRKLRSTRPDIVVFIVDLVISNLRVAGDILKGLVGRNIFLVHGDATALIFEENTFDGYWSVQTLQHVPNFYVAVKEAHRVLKPGGIFANYSLNNSSIIRFIYFLLGKCYHIEGRKEGSFYLSRGSVEQITKIQEIFSNFVEVRYSEILFTRDLGLCFPGKENSIIGRLDSLLSNNKKRFSSFARQQSYHTIKSMNKRK